MKRVAAVLLILLALGVASCNRQQPQGSTVVVVVRHAGKASNAEDSPLNEAGTQRARTLAAVAAGANVGVIYTTQFKRTTGWRKPPKG